MTSEELDKVYDKIEAGETVYVQYPFENARLKSIPGENGGDFVRFENEPEVEISSASKLSADAWLYGKEITETEYNK